MVGSVSSAPIPVGQGQNAYQQAQAAQGPASAEQRDPREGEVQRRNEPAAQSQESNQQQFLRRADDRPPTEIERGLDEARDPTSNDNAQRADAERGELLDVLV